MRRVLTLITATALLLGACASADGDPPSDDAAGSSAAEDTGPGSGDATTTTLAPLPAGYEQHESEIYADPAHWICRGGVDDPCDHDLDATVVAADGSTEVEPFTPVADAPVDCFYVYPTISADPTPNSDLVPDEEIRTAVVHAARYGTLCRVFAPVYRQTTLTALFGRLGGDDEPAVDTRAIAYGDVVDAFKHYMANDNGGRGVVLMGHSQGSGLLLQLLAEEFDDEPALRDRLVGALILGSTVTVPEGADVGGDLANIPLCRTDDQVGCVVTYASFRSTAPPQEGAFFGRPREGDGVAGCVNPAAPAGERAPLTGYWPTAEVPWVAGTTIDTPFVKVPGLVDGECVERDGFSYLEVTVNGDPADPRVDDIKGDLTPEWGLHGVDVQLTLGDAVEMVGRQTAAWTDAHPGSQS